MSRLMHAVLFVLLTSPAWAQPAGSVTVQVPVQRTTSSGDGIDTSSIVSGAASIEHWFAHDLGRVFYEVALDRYQTDDAWDTWLHNAGGVRTFTFGKTSLDAGAAFFWRATSGGWADAGFRGVNLQSSVQRELPRGSVMVGHNFYVRRFEDAPALDQIEHAGNVRALANFPSRTTLIAAASVGWKRYDGGTIATSASGDAGSAGRGPGRGNMLLRPVVTYSIAGDPIRRTSWSWSARVAQSLDDRTGVWMEREERRTDGEPPPAIVWTPPLFYDDGVYDDPYAIEARTWRAGVRHLFARGDELGVWASRSQRGYAGLGVLDATGEVSGQRTDTLVRGGVDATILLQATSRVDLRLVGGYGYVKNGSNDAAEAYRSHVVSLGLNLRF